MNRSKKVFGFIQPKLPGTVLCGDMLVVCPTEHIVRGFILETTTERDLIYLWRVVTPLHRPMRHVFLNYSDRIFAGEKRDKFFIDRNAYRESAEVVQATVAEHIPFLQNIRKPHDFLRHIAWRIGSSAVHFRFDLALTHCRIGNIKKATEILDMLNLEVDQLDEAKRTYFDAIIKQVARVAISNPDGLIPLLDEWEKTNVEVLGLQPTRTPRDGTRLLQPV